MNVARILIGGAVAGIIMNVGEAALHGAVLAADTDALYKAYHLPAPNPAVNIPILVGVTFIMGITSIWLYAAIRPRFGAGIRTAVIAGIAVWVLSHLWSGVYLANGYAGIFTMRLAWLPVFWGLFEATLATIAGAALYKE